MVKIKFFFVYLCVIVIASINLSLAYANNAVPTIGASGIGLTQPFNYTKVKAHDLSSLVLNNAGGLNVVDIRSKEVFDTMHLQSAEHLTAEELSNLLVNMSFDIAKPVLIIGEDASLNDFFAKMASFYGYEAYIFEDDLSSLNSNVKLVSSAEENKEISQIDTQAVVDAARQGINESIAALTDLASNLGNLISTDVVDINLISETISRTVSSITNQINMLRGNPFTAMFFTTDTSVTDVLLDIFMDDRRVRNGAHDEGVVDALNYMGGDISRRDARRMGRNKGFQRRQVIDTANDIKVQGFNEGVTDTLRLMGIDLSRRDINRINKSERNQIDAVRDAADTIESKGYDKGYQAGYEDGYNAGVRKALLNSGLSGFRLAKLDRKYNKTRMKNFNPRDNMLQRRIDKVEERVGTKKLRRFTRKERRSEFRDYGFIKKGRTVIDMANNIPIVSEGVKGLVPFGASFIGPAFSVLASWTGVGAALGNIISPVVGIGSGVLMFGVNTALGMLGDSDYRTQIQKDMRVQRYDRRDLRRTNRQDRVVGMVPFPKILPFDNIVRAGFNTANKKPIRNTIRQTRLALAGSDARRAKMNVRFERRDYLDDKLIRPIDSVRSILGTFPIPMIAGLPFTILNLGIGFILPVIGGPIGAGINYVWNIFYNDILADDYASRVRDEFSGGILGRKAFRDAVKDDRKTRREENRLEEEFGVDEVNAGSSRQLGPNRNTIGNAIEIGMSLIQNGRGALQDTRVPRRENRQKRQGNIQNIIRQIIQNLQALSSRGNTNRATSANNVLTDNTIVDEDKTAQ